MDVWPLSFLLFYSRDRERSAQRVGELNYVKCLKYFTRGALLRV
jgi:hypothetical protein